MSFYAIGDLHLPGGDDKPMEVFGSHWEGHFERIRQDWLSRVREEDIVLLPGDLSWAMRLADAVQDLQAIGALPGRKLLVKGNHDYWWSSLTQLRAVLPPGMQAVQHAAVDVGEAVVCGTRGWMIPTRDAPLSAADAKLYARELQRMEMALLDAEKLRAGRPLVVMMHYPPLLLQEMETDFTRLMERFGVHTVVYGHLHGAGIRTGFSGEWRGVRYQLVSCDSLNFSLASIPL